MNEFIFNFGTHTSHCSSITDYFLNNRVLLLEQPKPLASGLAYFSLWLLKAKFETAKVRLIFTTRSIILTNLLFSFRTS